MQKCFSNFFESFRMSESPDDTVSGKKTTTRRNAWGNMSYAELITTAIMASPEKRLTLAQGERFEKNFSF